MVVFYRSLQIDTQPFINFFAIQFAKNRTGITLVEGCQRSNTLKLHSSIIGYSGTTN